MFRRCLAVVAATSFVVAGLAPTAVAAAPPVAAVTSPALEATVRGMVTITADATADGESGQSIARVEFLVDGVAVQIDTEAPYEAVWDATAATGRHALSVRVTDAPAGTSAESTQVPVTVAGPTVSLTAPAAGSLVYGAVALAATAAAFPDDGSTIGEVRFYAADQLVGVDPIAPYDVVWDTDVLAEGPISVHAVAVDSTGQRSSSSARTVTVARPAPVAMITAPSPGALLGGVVTLGADATPYAAAGHTVGRVDFLVDGVAVGSDAESPYTLAWDTTTVTPGAHEIRARAVDAPAGRAGVSEPVAISVAGAPAVFDVSPEVAPVGATVTIAGEGFTAATGVAFSGVAAVFAVVSDTTITTNVPAAAASGPVTVTTPRGTASSSTPFGVDAPPAVVPSLTARAGDRLAVLAWTKPADADLAAVVVRRATGTTAPATPASGTLVYAGLGTSTTNTGLANGTTYAYSVWTRDAAGSYGPRRTIAVRPVAAPATALRVGVSAGTLNYGGAVTVSGILTLADGRTAVAGEPVDVFVRRQGTAPWTWLGRFTTTAAGRIAYVHRPPWNAEYTLRHPGTAFAAASGSPNARVAVRPTLSVRITQPSVLLGATVTISGAVVPAHAGQPVQLQQYVSGAWRTIATRALSSSGGYAFAVRPAASGAYAYRVLKPADADHVAVASATVRLAIYRATIAKINADAPGNDLHNPNGEWALIRNTGAVAINLAGWHLDAGDSGQRFALPPYVLPPGAAVAAHTGTGATTAGHVYLGSGQPIWNNDGDIGSLYDPRWALAARYAY